MLSKKWHDNVYCILIGAFHIYQAIQGIDYAITFVYTEEEKNTEKSIFKVKKHLIRQIYTPIPVITDQPDSNEKNYISNANHYEPLCVIKVTVWNWIKLEPRRDSESILKQPMNQFRPFQELST